MGLQQRLLEEPLGISFVGSSLYICCFRTGLKLCSHTAFALRYCQEVQKVYTVKARCVEALCVELSYITNFDRGPESPKHKLHVKMTQVSNFLCLEVYPVSNHFLRSRARQTHRIFFSCVEPPLLEAVKLCAASQEAVNAIKLCASGSL